MEPISKTVRERLAQQQQAADHPDSDLLTAYAENTLAARERESVVAHLARCQPCRDVVVLAAPEAPANAAVPEVATASPGRRWYALPALRWVATVAVIAVVGVTFTFRQKLSAPAPPRSGTTERYVGPASDREQAASAQPAPPPAARAAGCAGKAEQLAKTSPRNPSARQFDVIASKTKAEGAKDGAKDERKSNGFQTLAQVPMSDSATRAGLQAPEQSSGTDNAKDSPSFKKQLPTSTPLPNAAASLQVPPLHNAPMKAAQSNAVIVAKIPPGTPPPTKAGAVNETVEVNAAAAQMDTVGSVLAAPVPAASTEAERADALAKRPAISADTAVYAMRAGAAGGATGYAPPAVTTAGQTATCSLTADGVRCVRPMKESSGPELSKLSTEIHRPEARLKAIASQGNVIWAGGDALLRSADAGVTWEDVKKPSGESITQIVVMTDAIYVRTASGAMWKTSDNGATWAQTPATQ